MIKDIKILDTLKKSVVDKEKFFRDKILALGKHTFHGRDLMNFRISVNQTHDFDQWKKSYKSFRSVQVYEMQDYKKIFYHLKKIKKWKVTNIKNIILFYNPVNGFSVARHTDVYNIRLYVIKGFKKVYVGNKIVYLKAGDYIDIPEFTPHMAFSRANTWALSIAMSRLD